MLTKEVKFQDARFDVDLKIRAERVVDAIRRSMLHAEALEKKGDDQAENYVRLVIYPDFTVCVDKETAKFVIDGLPVNWPPSADEFVNWPGLPNRLYDMWYDAVYACNPHWIFQPDDSEKKGEAMISIPG